MKVYKPYQKEQDQIQGKFHPRGPKSKKLEQEFGLAKQNILICKKCKAVYQNKSWHHESEDNRTLSKDKFALNVKFVLCPACQMIKDKKYEGEIILSAVPEKFKNNIKFLAENYGERAFREDPMDRIISIKEERDNIRILTTENQLAQRLAKKVNETFGGKLKVAISHSHEEDVIRIKIFF